MTYVYDSYLSSELRLVGPYIALGASPPAGGGGWPQAPSARPPLRENALTHSLT